MIVISNFEPKKQKEEIFKIFQAYPNLFLKQEYLMLRSDLLEGSDEYCIKLVALDNNQAVGFLAVVTRDDIGKSREINWLVVDPAYRRKKVAFNLLAELEKIMKSKKVERLFVETCTCSGEAPARGFYEKNGFIPQATLTDFYGKGHSDVIYQKLYS